MHYFVIFSLPTQTFKIKVVRSQILAKEMFLREVESKTPLINFEKKVDFV